MIIDSSANVAQNNSQPPTSGNNSTINRVLQVSLSRYLVRVLVSKLIPLDVERIGRQKNLFNVVALTENHHGGRQ